MRILLALFAMIGLAACAFSDNPRDSDWIPNCNANEVAQGHKCVPR